MHETKWIIEWIELINVNVKPFVFRSQQKCWGYERMLYVIMMCVRVQFKIL